MNTYFKMLHSVADTNKKDYTSVRELTIDLAKSGGYRRELVTLKNGKQVMRTKYNIPATWDCSLVAKWFCQFERLFKSKLLCHPEISDYYTEILQRTFTIYFNALQIDKLGSDSNVNTVVYTCLANRIGEVFILKGSEERMKRFNSYENSDTPKKSQDRVNLKSAFNHMCIPIDELSTSQFRSIDVAESGVSDLVLDISREFKGNDIGLRLLEAMLNSEQKVDISRVRDFVKLDKSELSRPTASKLTEAYRTIVSKVREYYPEYDYTSALEKRANLRKVSKKVYEMEM